MSDMIIGLEEILTEMNLSEELGDHRPEQVIAAVMLLGTLQRYPLWFYTEDEVDYLVKVAKYLEEYTARMN
jgi:hypothetical protein